MTHEQAAAYRRRADHLRSLALRIEHTPAMSIEHHADVDTWFGPRPEACRTSIATAQQAARSAAAELRSAAWRFDQHAVALEAAAP